jgi:hypothetical protein
MGNHIAQLGSYVHDSILSPNSLTLWSSKVIVAIPVKISFSAQLGADFTSQKNIGL